MITVDVGNSSIGVGVLDRGQWSVRRAREPEQAAAWIDAPAAVISVAPSRLLRLQHALAARGGAPLQELLRPPPQLARAAPSLLEQAGADRLANALALLPGPGIAVDAGTAVTVDIVDAAGIYQGGFIAPGPAAAASGLAAATAGLPRLDGLPHAWTPGSSTREALAAGLWGMSVGGVDLLVAAAKEFLGNDPATRVVVTGGWGAAWAASTRLEGVTVDGELVHRGIARWAGWS